MTAACSANYLPSGKSGGVEVREIVLSDHDASMGRLMGMMHGRSGIRAGTYTGLYRNGGLWMSNTPDEIRDHREFLYQAADRSAVSAVINGLGLGMVVVGLLEVPSLRQVDVVEIDADVIALVAPTLVDMAAGRGVTVTVHHADAYQIRWPAGTRWTVGWSDIWQDLCSDNLADMARLRRKYARRTDWHDCWSRREVLAHQRRHGW